MQRSRSKASGSRTPHPGPLPLEGRGRRRARPVLPLPLGGEGRGEGLEYPNARLFSSANPKFAILNSQFSIFNFRLAPLLLAGALLGCSPKKSETPEQRSEAARTLFEHTTKTFHIPSAEAKGTEKESLQSKAADGYTQLLKTFPEQDYWAAQALRSLGNIRSAQGRINDAVQNYSAVEKRYPQQRWEVLMSWKSAADLLWDSGQRDQAKVFYQKIVGRYDTPQAPQVEQAIVRGSKLRLAGRDLPAEK